MNYRHGFHAGNFADVLKHALLARIIDYLKRKDAPFKVIDTHAGEGAYNLASDEAARTGEWRDGIGRLTDLSSAPERVRTLLAPYLACVGELSGGIERYPGSPLIAQRLLRAQDRAIFCELRADAFACLRRRFSGDSRTKSVHIDGYIGLSAFTPPPERRGVVLIDPPFERTDEFFAMFRAFRTAYKKWPTGIYVLWRPSKDRAAVNRFRAAFRQEQISRTLDVTLTVGGDSPGLRSTGLTVVNPPFVLEDEARVLLPFLCEQLSQGEGAAFAIERLTPYN